MSTASGRSESHKELVSRDKALALYEHVIASLFVTAMAATFLVVMLWSHAWQTGISIWLISMLLVLGGRLLDRTFFYPRFRAGAVAPQTAIRRFSVGTMATASVWAIFPPLFYPAIGDAGRAAAMVVIASMAGGSSNVLGASLPLAMSFCVALLASSTATLFFIPGQTDLFLAVLSLVMVVAMVLSARIANHSIVGAFRLGHRNQELFDQTELTNRELRSAQAELRELNGSLEQRIEARTAALEHEIIERKHYTAELARLASTDPLTDLSNRTRFTELLSAMLAQAQSDGTAVGLLFLDLDDFKKVNDVRGHATGDRVLREVARLLRDRAGQGAEVARWGGDEFIVAVPVHPGILEVSLLAHLLREGLAAPILTEFGEIRLGVTVGVAHFPLDATTGDELIRAADVAMFKAKRERKGVKFFDRGLARELEKQHLTEQALRQAIGNSEMSLAFQPIVAASDGRCTACEVLLRWTHPLFGSVSPSVFIPVAEQSGQICAIGRWVLAEACRVAASWADPSIAVTVNISVLQLLSGTLLADVEAACVASGLPTSRLQIEITESVFLSDRSVAVPVLVELRERGVRILLDDFGTGFCSLAYLGQLPVDVVKIDRSFVSCVDGDGFSVIQAILLICRAYGLEVTAEGIETEYQRRRLTQLGVDRLQGYFLGRPVPSEVLDLWFRNQSTAEALPLKFAQVTDPEEMSS